MSICPSFIKPFVALGLIMAFAGGGSAPIRGQLRTPATTMLGAATIGSIEGAWRVTETGVRNPGGDWEPRAVRQGGLYVFSARHYSYFYVRGAEPRARFGDANRPTDAEKAAAFDSFIAGAGTYTLTNRTLVLKAEFRKNPNEMTGEDWRWQVDAQGNTLRLVFSNPPFLPGRDWRITLVRAE